MQKLSKQEMLLLISEVAIPHLNGRNHTAPEIVVDSSFVLIKNKCLHVFIYSNPRIMRKLIVSMNVTLDGFMAGPDCELDWHFNYWNDEMARCAGEQLSKADTILLGRITYNAMAQHWPSKLTDLLCPKEDIVFADMINSYQKIVFSKTLRDATWNNSRLARQSIKKEVIALKRQPGKDMIIYGSGSIVSTLTRLNLIDEYILWLHPVVLGKGKLLFKNVSANPGLKLWKSRVFSTGVIILYYVTVGNE